MPGQCLLKIEGLELNQKYVFAVAAYNSQGNMLGNSVGATSVPILAAMPLPLLSTWAHLAQVNSKHLAIVVDIHITKPFSVLWLFCVDAEDIALSEWLPFILLQVAYKTEQFTFAKRACRTLWIHFTYHDNGSQSNKDKLATTTGWGRNCIIFQESF